jgi:hypothetical protein
MLPEFMKAAVLHASGEPLRIGTNAGHIQRTPLLIFPSKTQ